MTSVTLDGSSATSSGRRWELGSGRRWELGSGAYALDALARSVAATLEALGAPAGAAGSSAADGLAVAPLARDALARLTPWWPGLG